MNDDHLLIQLRDCFTGGYTLPQFCIDNKIKKPLFVTERKFWQFAWEIHVQFAFDKRLTAQFAILDAPSAEINFSAFGGQLRTLSVKNISEINPADFDAIICLTSRKISFDIKTIRLDALTDYFIRKTYVEIPLLNFWNRHPQVKLFLTNFPVIGNYPGGIEFNKQLKNLEQMRTLLRNGNGQVLTPLDKFGYTNSEVLELMDAPKITTNPDGSTDMKDTNENSLQRISGGKRVTVNQPAHYRNKIYFVGSCHHYGVNAPFDKTIESYLQRLLNENNLPYCVENESQRYYNRYQDIFYNLNRLTPAPGDIIFVWIENLSAENIPFVDVGNVFAPPHDYREIFCVRGHVNELGYKILAQVYFKFLTANNFFRDIEFKVNTPPPRYVAFMVYLRNSRLTKKIFSTRNWKSTSKSFVRIKFRSAQSS